MGTAVFAEYRIGGSDLFSSLIPKAIEDNGFEFSFTGSISGLSALRNGELDAAILAFAEGQPPDGNWMTVPFAFQAVTVAVHESNPMSQISFEQLRAIFGVDGGATEWGDLVQDPQWALRKISVAAVRPTQNLSLEIFTNLVLNDIPLRQTTLFAEDNARFRRAMEEDRNLICVFSGLVDAPWISPLSVSRESGAQAYGSTEDNILFGDYPLRMPFYLLLSNDLDASQKLEILDKLFGPRVEHALIGDDYMPLPEIEQDRILEVLR